MSEDKKNIDLKKETSNNGVYNNIKNFDKTPYIIIIILLVIISILSFFIGKNYNVIFNKNVDKIVQNTNNENDKDVIDPKDIVVKIIGDVRCIECQTDMITDSLKQLPFLSGATFEKMDFSDNSVKELLKANNITKLPAFLFNTNKLPDSQFVQYLNKTPSGLYSLNIGATFDPYAKRSERGFLLLKDGVLEEIIKNSHIYGNKNAEILWVEYSDMNCGYCVKLHNEGTHDALFSKFGNKLAFAYQYFAIFNKEAPIVFECIAKQKGVDVMYNTIKKAYKEDKKDKSSIAGLVSGINNNELNKCIDSGEFNYKIEKHMKMGSEIFGITGTPGNILINTKTLEYSKIPGFAKVQEFEKIINSLLTK